MEKVKLVVLVWSMAYALVTLLLFSNLAWAIEPQSQVHESGADELPSQVEADSGTYHDEPSARSRSQHRSNKGRSPIFPGGPGLAMAPTVSGWVFCASCMNVNLPLLGIEAVLLCPHPPPTAGGGGGSAGSAMYEVASTVTSKDGAFHLTANASYASIMNQCAVIIAKSSVSNCDLPPPTGTSIPVSTSSTPSEAMSAPDVLHYSVGSFSFRPASCSFGKPRSLLQHGEEPLGMEQGPEKNQHHKSTRNPISGSDPHGGNEEPALLAHPIKHSSRSYSSSSSQYGNDINNHNNEKDKRTMRAAAGAGALKLPSFLLKSTAMHSRTSFPKSMMMVNPSSRHPTVQTSSRRVNRGGGGPPTEIYANSRRHTRGGTPRAESVAGTLVLEPKP
ncbi:hypothetical protein MPTK1_1g29680 [Marchantia polymorpha subsp. ruderalis]|uniref:Uncharacterized protein n=2 Tax=Marchantia polymorpha TaxID=3197 RepID=A0AAF6AVN2_MARPO|nr:hypothetical protein MARPO_0139s0006 [Marchantia polymorpha]BBN00503.1 hypothetical protein Mp_1g29680 [Marchantia polymorpha subsp. ruderalis]|eukprot:PTQ29528.1 hypothetical protein MARPO_0139s0006 [Marchantia polymorpha]